MIEAPAIAGDGRSSWSSRRSSSALRSPPPPWRRRPTSSSPPRAPRRPATAPSRLPPPTSTATPTRTSRSRTQASDNVTILRNNGSGNFTEPASSPEAAGDGPRSVVAADLDGDTDQDLAVANNGSDNVTILLNSAPATSPSRPRAPRRPATGPTSVAAADLDGDTDQDLAVANLSSDNVTILRNNGSGNFTQPASSPEAAGAQPFVGRRRRPRRRRRPGPRGREPRLQQRDDPAQQRLGQLHPARLEPGAGGRLARLGRRRRPRRRHRPGPRGRETAAPST